MVSAVTIGGSTGKPVILQFDSTSNYTLAAQIAARINAGLGDGSVVLTYNPSDTAETIPGGKTGAFVQTGPMPARLTASFPIDLVNTGGSAVVLGSDAPNQVVLSDQFTNLTFVANAGSGTVVAGGGNNRLAVSGDSTSGWSLFTGDGNDLISALGELSATIGAGGGLNAIALGGGHDLVVSSGSDLIAAGSGAVTVDATAAQNDFVQGQSSHLLFLGGAGNTTIVGGTGSDTYYGAAGSTFAQMQGWSGQQLIEGGSAGNNLLMAGDGAATLVGGGDNDQLYAYGFTGQLLKASGGNETLSAALSFGNDTLVAGPGHDLIVTSPGQDTVIGGSGQATVKASPGTTFEFVNHQAGGTELVTGMFDPSSIHIDLDGYGHDEIRRALDSQTVQNGSVTISLTDGTKVTFEDVTSLNRSNFTSH